MSVTLEYDRAQHARALAMFAALPRKTVAPVFRQEAKLMVEEATSFTPPFGDAPVMESWNAQRKIGQAAVQRDIERAFPGADFLFRDHRVLANPKLEKRLRQYIAGGEVRKIKSVLEDFGIRADVVAEPDTELFERSRDNRGRYKRRRPLQIVLNQKAVKAFIRQKQAHVGKAKGGWSPAAAALGLKLPNWITRHGSRGVIEDRLLDRHPTISFGNAVEWIQQRGRELGIIGRVLRNRTRNIKAKIEKALAYEAAKAARGK